MSKNDDVADPAGASAPADRRRNFYGRRKGRKLRSNQQGWMEELLPRLTIALPEDGSPLDPASLFPCKMDDIWLEIGFGGGEHLAAQAAAHPKIGFIGCEVFVNGIASLLGHLDHQRGEGQGSDNVRIYPEDARDLLARLPERSLGRLFLLFPDPWPKARHARRRFVNPGNLDLLARLLKPGAELRIGSDDPTYIGWALAHASNHPAFTWLAQSAADWQQRPADWPPSRYEQKAIRQGRQPAYFRFRRNG
ncbi:MAG TPA: tRNA (guanine(46)-N(7))-methyltransferase TrmB [Terriglobia bacterium]|nr:tRNA (guanine(46)-N(7))-methyltransferase TrmB [Terriglobia bacterium]